MYDTFAQNSRRYEFCDIFAHTVVKNRKTVKSAKNTISNTCAQNSRRYEFCDTFAHTVVITVKRLSQLRKQFVTLVHKTRGYISFVIFLLIQFNKP